MHVKCGKKCHQQKDGQQGDLWSWIKYECRCCVLDKQLLQTASIFCCAMFFAKHPLSYFWHSSCPSLSHDQKEFEGYVRGFCSCQQICQLHQQCPAGCACILRIHEQRWTFKRFQPVAQISLFVFQMYSYLK